MEQDSLRREYWENRYKNLETVWDIGYPSTPIISYFNAEVDKSSKILIPGCGNAYEAGYLHEKGYDNVYILDFARSPLENFQKAYENFPAAHVIYADFFEHNDSYDIIVEQTFFCALDPGRRKEYVQHMYDLLNHGGRLIGLLFNCEFDAGPPFGGSKDEYEQLFSPKFKIEKLETAVNSIEPRQGNELFAIFKKENTEQ